MFRILQKLKQYSGYKSLDILRNKDDIIYVNESKEIKIYCHKRYDGYLFEYRCNLLRKDSPYITIKIKNDIEFTLNRTHNFYLYQSIDNNIKILIISP